MCGICGQLQLNNGALVSAELLKRMRDRIEHRGPDDAGSYISPDGRVGLANRRLSIIDLSAAGHQPMSNEDGSIWIAYNGETYNFRDLRVGLEERGHKFRSLTDTEVIVHLYEEYGPDCVHHMRGMFAFAIWDARKQRLFIARDRLGVKPLYYTHVDGSFLFASEIKCLLEHPRVRRAVNEEALYHYLTFLITPAPTTLFEGIFKLPPGQRGFINASGELHLEEYWDVFDSVDYDARLSEAEHVERIRASLRKSIELRMISDVPFGVLLSGGIDSTTNLALMAEKLDRPVQTFSIGYEGAVGGAYNEFQYARQAAQHFGADHHEVLIGPQDLIDFLPKLIYHQDEPIADPVCVPVYFVSKLAKESGTTVVQVGEGADELFGGYSHWLSALRLHAGVWNSFTSLPRPIRQLSLTAASPILRGLRLEYLRRGAMDEELFWGGAIAFGELAKQDLLSASYRGRVAGLSSHDVIRAHRQHFDARSPLKDYLSWMGYLDLRMRLPELLLMRVDKMSMATSVEARVPFLDHEFVGLVMGISQQDKLNGFQPKQLLKKAVRGLIPDEIIDRPKQGFQVPVREWLDQELGSLTKIKLRELCQKTDYFDWPHVEHLLQRRHAITWYLLNFALWHELWIE